MGAPLQKGKLYKILGETPESLYKDPDNSQRTPVLCHMQPGTYVLLLEIDQYGWYKVLYEDLVGYCYARLG